MSVLLYLKDSNVTARLVDLSARMETTTAQLENVSARPDFSDNTVTTESVLITALSMEYVKMMEHANVTLDSLETTAGAKLQLKSV